jgi:hypothetical protein
MIRLTNAITAWGSPGFEEILKREIEQLSLAQLPLQQGLSGSSHALDKDISVLILHTAADDTHIRVKAGIFYKGIIAGCSCADDPTPVNENTEYCEVQFAIDKTSGNTRVTLLSQ